MSESTPKKQLLHLVLGGELKRLDSVEFKDLSSVDLVGVYPNYAAAHAAWRAKAQQTVYERAKANGLAALGQWTKAA